MDAIAPRETKFLASLLASSFFAVGCGSNHNSTVVDDFDHAGSFRDDRGNRLYSIETHGDLDADKTLDNARTYPYTPGQVTAIYYYPAGATIPRDGVTLAKDFTTATNVVHHGRGLGAWRFVYMRGFDGHETFVDCQTTPENDLCPVRKPPSAG